MFQLKNLKFVVDQFVWQNRNMAKCAPPPPYKKGVFYPQYDLGSFRKFALHLQYRIST